MSGSADLSQSKGGIIHEQQGKGTERTGVLRTVLRPKSPTFG